MVLHPARRSKRRLLLPHVCSVIAALITLIWLLSRNAYPLWRGRGEWPTALRFFGKAFDDANGHVDDGEKPAGISSCREIHDRAMLLGDRRRENANDEQPTLSICPMDGWLDESRTLPRFLLCHHGPRVSTNFTQGISSGESNDTAATVLRCRDEASHSFYRFGSLRRCFGLAAWVALALTTSHLPSSTSRHRRVAFLGDSIGACSLLLQQHQPQFPIEILLVDSSPSNRALVAASIRWNANMTNQLSNVGERGHRDDVQRPKIELRGLSAQEWSEQEWPIDEGGRRRTDDTAMVVIAGCSKCAAGVLRSLLLLKRSAAGLGYGPLVVCLRLRMTPEERGLLYALASDDGGQPPQMQKTKRGSFVLVDSGTQGWDASSVDNDTCAVYSSSDGYGSERPRAGCVTYHRGEFGAWWSHMRSDVATPHPDRSRDGERFNRTDRRRRRPLRRYLVLVRADLWAATESSVNVVWPDSRGRRRSAVVVSDSAYAGKRQLSSHPAGDGQTVVAKDRYSFANPLFAHPSPFACPVVAPLCNRAAPSPEAVSSHAGIVRDFSTTLPRFPLWHHGPREHVSGYFRLFGDWYDCLYVPGLLDGALRAVKALHAERLAGTNTEGFEGEADMLEIGTNIGACAALVRSLGWSVVGVEPFYPNWLLANHTLRTMEEMDRRTGCYGGGAKRTMSRAENQTDSRQTLSEIRFAALVTDQDARLAATSSQRKFGTVAHVAAHDNLGDVQVVIVGGNVSHSATGRSDETLEQPAVVTLEGLYREMTAHARRREPHRHRRRGRHGARAANIELVNANGRDDGRTEDVDGSGGEILPLLKLDCQGCEWSALAKSAEFLKGDTSSGTGVIPHIAVIMFEFSPMHLLAAAKHNHHRAAATCDIQDAAVGWEVLEALLEADYVLFEMDTMHRLVDPLIVPWYRGDERQRVQSLEFHGLGAGALCHPSGGGGRDHGHAVHNDETRNRKDDGPRSRLGLSRRCLRRRAKRWNEQKFDAQRYPNCSFSGNIVAVHRRILRLPSARLIFRPLRKDIVRQQDEFIAAFQQHGPAARPPPPANASSSEYVLQIGQSRYLGDRPSVCRDARCPP